MGQLDFERFHWILQQMDRYGAMVWNGEQEAIKPFFVYMKQFYKNIRFMIVNKEKMDKKFASVERKINNLETIRRRTNNPINYLLPPIVKELDDLSNDIYELKQWSGLGIEIQKVISRRKKWSRAVGLSGE